MNQETSSNPARILLVGAQSGTIPLTPDPSLGITTESAPDVYRALARLLRGGDFDGVIVLLDCVGSRELRFFTILSKSCRGLKVLIHAGGAGESRIAKALEAGATGVFSAESWREFAPRPVASPVMTSSEPATPLANAPAPEEPAADDHPFEEPDEPPVEEIGEDPSTAPRVPWLRYADGPQRAAPPQRRPPPPTPPPQPSLTAPRSAPDYEPLLTEEEIEALMSDDISAIAPRSNSLRRRPERDEGVLP